MSDELSEQALLDALSAINTMITSPPRYLIVPPVLWRRKPMRFARQALWRRRHKYLVRRGARK
jgi:hypothetical protein